MVEFKVGDRVRILPTVPFYWWFQAGDTGTIITIRPNTTHHLHLIDVHIDHRPGEGLAHVDPSHIELIEEQGPW